LLSLDCDSGNQEERSEPKLRGDGESKIEVAGHVRQVTLKPFMADSQVIGGTIEGVRRNLSRQHLMARHGVHGNTMIPFYPAIKLSTACASWRILDVPPVGSRPSAPLTRSGGRLSSRHD